MRYASERLRDNRDIVLASLQNGGSMSSASERLKDDRDLVIESINWGNAYGVYGGGISERLRNDREIALMVAEKDPALLRFRGESLRNDPEMFLKLITADRRFAWTDKKTNLWHNREVILEALKINVGVLEVLGLEHINSELRNDPEIIVAAIMNQGIAISFAPEKFQKDCKFILLASKDPQTFKEIPWFSERYEGCLMDLADGMSDDSIINSLNGSSNDSHEISINEGDRFQEEHSSQENNQNTNGTEVSGI